MTYSRPGQTLLESIQDSLHAVPSNSKAMKNRDRWLFISFVENLHLNEEEGERSWLAHKADDPPSRGLIVMGDEVVHLVPEPELGDRIGCCVVDGSHFG